MVTVSPFTNRRFLLVMRFILLYFLFLVILLYSTIFQDSAASHKIQTINSRYPVITRSEISARKFSFVYRGSRKTFNIWTAICDERLSRSHGRTAVHILFYWNKNVSNDLETRQMFKNNWRCRLYFDITENYTASVDVPVNALIGGQYYDAIISCFFKADLFSCPNFVSILSGTEPNVTHRVRVERQKMHRGPGIIFCAPLIVQLKGAGFHNSHQFVEWIEYLRFVGFSKVVMAEPITESPLFPFSMGLYHAIQYYKRTGFLQTFPATYSIYGQNSTVRKLREIGLNNSSNSNLKEQEKIFYKSVQLSKELLCNYCMLRYGTRFSYVMVGDFDEFPAFDISKYGDIMAAIEDVVKVHREKYNRDISSFVMRSMELVKCDEANDPDRVFFHTRASLFDLFGTLPTKVTLQDVLGNDSRILDRGIQAQWWDLGKSIYSSNYSYMIWHHWNLVTLKQLDFFDASNNGNVSDVFHLKLTHDINRTHQGELQEDIISLWHARKSADVKNLSQREHEDFHAMNCRQRDKWTPAKWLNAVKPELLKKIYDTYQKMGAVDNRQTSVSTSPN